jgi:hypothetical protein
VGERPSYFGLGLLRCRRRARATGTLKMGIEAEASAGASSVSRLLSPAAAHHHAAALVPDLVDPSVVTQVHIDCTHGSSSGDRCR